MFIVGFVFILGLIVGSFINMALARYNTGLSFNKRSFCFSCGHMLSWYDLIPLVSFIMQSRKCRYCQSKISFQYPVVELITGVLFVFIFFKLDPSFSVYYLLLTTYYLLIFSILLSIAVYDIRHKIIPNAFVYSFIILSFLGLIFEILNLKSEILNLLAGPLLALPFAALWLFSKGKWMGLGDGKLTLGIGWLLGLSSGAAALILAIWMGAFYGILILAISNMERIKRHLFPHTKTFTMKSEIPFAPFLILGTLFAFLYDISFADIQSLFSKLLS